MFTNKTRGIAVAAFALLVIPALAACSPGSSDNAKGDGINIAYLTYTVTDYPKAVQRGAESVVVPDGGSVKIFNANFDPQTQLSQCLDVVSSGRYDGIILSPIDPATGVPCVKAAHEAGIPVGTNETGVGKDAFSLKPQVPGVVAVVGTPIQTSVDAIGKLLQLACGKANPCEVIAEIANPADPFTNTLTDAIAKQYDPEIKIVQRISTGYDPAEVAKQLPDALSAHPNVTVFMSVSDQSGLAAAPALEAAGLQDKVKVTAVGGSTEGAAAVKAGTLFGTIGNWPQQYGAALATALVQAHKGEKVSKVSIDMLTLDKPQQVTKDTVSQFKPEWGVGAN